MYRLIFWILIFTKMKINIALLTITDTRTMENDKSGEILVKNGNGKMTTGDGK